MSNHTNQTTLVWPILATALGCGLSAGVFFAFSSFVMPGLHRIQPAEAIAAMNGINKSAETPLFLTVLFGSALACVGLSIYSLANWSGQTSVFVLVATALYLIGPIGLTGAHHVPLNNALMDVHPHTANAADHWRHYYAKWVPWNHIRTLTGLGATGMLAVALRAAA